MKMFKNGQGSNSSDSVTAFEKNFVNPEKKVNPIMKTGSIVLYSSIVVAVVICIVMAILDKTGVAPTTLDEKNVNQLPEIVEIEDIESYPESLQKLYKENFEASGFVSSYFKLKDKNKEVSLKAYKKTGEVPLFIQFDKQWGYRQYGDDFVGVNGDGPMCLAMVGYYLTRDEKFSPEKIVAFSDANGYYLSGKGTTSKLMTEGAEALGLTSEMLTVSTENIVASLQQGKPVICFMNAGSFATKAHFIVIRAYGEGYLLINDPESIVNSQKQWEFNEITSQVKAAWAFAPAAA